MSDSEHLSSRVYGDASLPTLIYLPGLHGDWTLVSSFRAAVQGKVRFVEITYPRTTTWSLEDYASAVIHELQLNGVRSGWILGESFGSQVAWQVVKVTQGSHDTFSPAGIILAGGFARYPIMTGVRCVRFINALMPPWMIRIALRIYASYAKLRHRRAPETLACIEEFVARRTEPDRQAILHRYGLILASSAAHIAQRCTLPVYALCGFVDPVVPWPWVLPWLRKHCREFRGWRIIFNADHNVLGTAPEKSARQVMQWMAAH